VRRQGIDWRTVVTTQSTAESGRMETLVLARARAHAGLDCGSPGSRRRWKGLLAT
jgi:hypothetical protein